MKDKHPLISVIIPVFNVAPYLNRCMETIVSQTYRNLQIIMVDDGSTDFSGSLCDQWKKADNRIKVIHKKNEGLGMARNSGIIAAEGEYFLFVDSDDYVDKVMAEKLLQTLVIQQADICVTYQNRCQKEDLGETKRVKPGNAGKPRNIKGFRGILI